MQAKSRKVGHMVGFGQLAGVGSPRVAFPDQQLPGAPYLRSVAKSFPDLSVR